MRAAITLVSVVVLALVAGCTAQIPDGRIGCMVSRACPMGFSCWSDGICRRMHEPDASVDAASVDAFVPGGDGGPDAFRPDGGGGPGHFYEPCGASCPTDSDCYAGSYCAPRCRTGMCPPDPEPAGVCREPSCLLVCTTPGGGDTCPAGSMCALGRWTASGTTGACADMATIFPASHGMACTTDAMCTRPDACINGACVRPCDAMGPCGAGENCAPVPMMGTFACLANCGAGCPAMFECVTPPGAPSASCFPTAWAVAGTRS